MALGLAPEHRRTHLFVAESLTAAPRREGGGFSASAQAQLGQHPADVRLHGFLADDEAVRDLGVGEPLGDQADVFETDVALTSLDATEVAAVDLDLVGECLLGNALRFAELANSPTRS